MAQEIASPIRVFYTDNDTDSLADALKAAGVAEALRSWLRVLDLPMTPIIIEDKGGYHQITLPVGLDEAAVERITSGFTVGRAQVLVSSSQQEKAAKAGRRLNGFDYERYRETRSAYFNAYLSRPKAEREALAASEAYAQIKTLEPPLELSLYDYINQFPAAVSYNPLVEQWHSASEMAARSNMRFLLRAFLMSPNPLDAAVEAWEAETAGAGGKASATLLQIINPTTGKGANSPKTDTNVRATGLNGFWLIEYLKFVGLFTLGAPLVVRGSKDRKTYVLRPVKVELGVLDGVMNEFRKRVSKSTAVKVDVVTTLLFTETLVKYMCEALRADGASAATSLLAMFGEAPPRVTDIARGFEVAFYKKVGSAFATMNLAAVNLPEWLDEEARLDSVERAEAALEVLREHMGVIRNIQTAKGDEGSDEYELLRRYRDFFSGRELEGFLDFAARYGDYLLAKMHRKQWAGQFTTEGLDFLMKQARQTYAPIIENAGFRAIATAIRSATVRAQYASARERGYPYEVRYGLGQELLRAAAYPQEFLATLGAFVQSYNAENARIDERITKGSLKTHRRASVRTDDLDQVVRLIDAYNGNSELICKLLLAYGYARDGRASGEQVETAGGAVEDEADELVDA